VVDYGLSRPCIAEDVTPFVDPDSVRLRRAVHYRSRENLRLRGVSEWITVSAEVNRIARFDQFGQPVETPDACLPHREPFSQGGIDSSWEQTSIGLFEDSDVPPKHWLTRPHRRTVAPHRKQSVQLLVKALSFLHTGHGRRPPTQGTWMSVSVLAS